MADLERIGIVGAGWVGSGLAMELARQPEIANHVVLTGRSAEGPLAAILDAASAYPDSTAASFTCSEALTGEFDVVVITAGLQPGDVSSGEELLERNTEIATKALEGVETQHVVLLGTPVDQLTERIASLTSYAVGSVIGFGGELDLARLKYSLLERDMPTEGVRIIGEHGPNTIPFLPGNPSKEQYEDVQAATANFLKRIKQGGRPRNLASGVQLARLLRALGGKEAEHHVSRPDKRHDDLSLTWPRRVTSDGAGPALGIDIGPRPAKLLENLVQRRLREREMYRARS